MKKARILIVMFLALASFGFAQEKLTDTIGRAHV